MERLFPFLIALALAPGAWAGAWPRDKGAWFISLGARGELGDAATDVGPTLFLEYGLTERMTLGIDAWKSAAWPDWMATGFVRLPLSDGDASVKLAFSLGAGLGHKSGTTQPVMMGGLHAGKGLPKGWLAADLTATAYLDAGVTDTKLSTTWGHRLGGPWTSVLTTDITGSGDVQLDQSLVYELRDGLRLRAGYGHPVRGNGTPGLTFQTWIEF